MSTPSYSACVGRAITTLKGRTILYSESDCQDAVEQIVQDCGGEMEFSGSNDMWRNAVIAVMPKEKAIRLGILKGAELTFIHDDGHNAKYKDEEGDASHVGMFIGDKAVWDNAWNGSGGWCNVFHSSQSRGYVCGSNLSKNNWTHVALAACISYPDSVYAAFGVQKATVVSQNSGVVNFRKTKSTSGSRICGIPSGSSVLIGESDGEWSRIAYGGKSGYVKSEFLSDSQAQQTGGTSMYEISLGSGTVATTGGVLFFRSSPEKNSSNKIGGIPNGSTVQVLADAGNGWYRINYDGAEGYVSSEFVKLGSSAETCGLFIPCASVSAAQQLQNLLKSGVVKNGGA